MHDDSIDTIKKAWEQEYQRKGIPSSFRKDPTQVVVQFISWMQREHQVLGGRAADIGCGQGRNSFYLASAGFEVIGIELLEKNVQLVNQEARSKNLPIQAFAQDAASPWPIQKGTLDIAIDVFCYKHIVDKSKQKLYRQHLWQALKKEGLYFISLASIEDGFYGPLLKESPHPEHQLIIDPYAQIPSFLYSIESLSQEFVDHFQLLHISEDTSTSPMYGKPYVRKVLNAVFQKKSLGKF